MRLVSQRSATFAAFALVALSFFASTVASLRSLDIVRESALTVRQNEGRSIEYLYSMRGHLFTLYRSLDRILDGTQPQEAMRGEIARSMTGIDTNLRSYDLLPDLPGEPELQEALYASLDEAKLLAGKVLGAWDAGAPQRARSLLEQELSRVMERAQVHFDASLHLHAQAADALADQINDAHVRAQRKAYFFDSIAGLFSIATASLLVFAFSRFARTQTMLARLQKERADELELFAGRVSHDIMNPLTTISVASEAARRTGGVEGRHLDRIDSGVRRVRRIVKGLYDFARSGARPTASPGADVETVVADVLEDLQREASAAHVALRVDPFSRCAVMASEGVLTSLLENLVRNAIKHASGPDGRVTIRINTDRRVRVEVEDTGPGLPPGTEKEIFEPYKRLREARGQGLGLGLATVKRLSEGHGGACGVDSRPGVGCTFWFELPKSEEARPAVPAPK